MRHSREKATYGQQVLAVVLAETHNKRGYEHISPELWEVIAECLDEGIIDVSNSAEINEEIKGLAEFINFLITKAKEEKLPTVVLDNNFWKLLIILVENNAFSAFKPPIVMAQSFVKSMIDNELAAEEFKEICITALEDAEDIQDVLNLVKMAGFSKKEESNATQEILTLLENEEDEEAFDTAITLLVKKYQKNIQNLILYILTKNEKLLDFPEEIKSVLKLVCDQQRQEQNINVEVLENTLLKLLHQDKMTYTSPVDYQQEAKEQARPIFGAKPTVSTSPNVAVFPAPTSTKPQVMPVFAGQVVGTAPDKQVETPQAEVPISAKALTDNLKLYSGVILNTEDLINFAEKHAIDENLAGENLVAWGRLKARLIELETKGITIEDEGNIFSVTDSCSNLINQFDQILKQILPSVDKNRNINHEFKRLWLKYNLRYSLFVKVAKAYSTFTNKPVGSINEDQLIKCSSPRLQTLWSETEQAMTAFQRGAIQTINNTTFPEDYKASAITEIEKNIAEKIGYAADVILGKQTDTSAQESRQKSNSVKEKKPKQQSLERIPIYSITFILLLSIFLGSGGILYYLEQIDSSSPSNPLDSSTPQTGFNGDSDSIIEDIMSADLGVDVAAQEVVQLQEVASLEMLREETDLSKIQADLYWVFPYDSALGFAGTIATYQTYQPKLPTVATSDVFYVSQLDQVLIYVDRAALSE